MGGARGVSKAEQERRARQRAGTPAKEDLGALERRFKAKQEKIRESRTMTPEAKRLALNEVRRQFRQDWTKTRGQIIEQLDADAETARRTATPPASNDELERMGLLSNVYLSRWQRAPGNLAADAERFAEEGDAAGLRLVREHSGLLSHGARQTVLQSVGEAEERLMSDEQRAAATRVRSLAGDRDRFELGSAMREGFIRASTDTIGPAARIPAPMAGTPQPQR